jgi:F420-0:gamma-glutamyl ligase
VLLSTAPMSVRSRVDAFNVRNAIDRLKSLPANPSASMSEVRQAITEKARRKLGVPV